MAIDTLLPKKLDKSEASYKSVTELNDALSIAEKEHIRNIALTGPFGSGKSSVLITLMEDFANEYKFLPISLPTLQANEEQINDNQKERLVSDECVFRPISVHSVGILLIPTVRKRVKKRKISPIKK